MDPRAYKPSKSIWHSMSKQHGDKARFHRIRKQNTARRLRVRELQHKIDLAAAEAAGVLKIELAKI